MNDMDMTRREFLAKSGMLAGAAVLPGTTLMGKGKTEPAEKATGLPGVYGPKLKFRPDGTFKIVQFTDTHYIIGHRGCPRMLKLLPAVLDKEKPDLVVYTGDMVFDAPAVPALKEVLHLTADKGIPFAYVFGNHDAEYDEKQPALYKAALSVDGNVMPPYEAEGKMDYAVTIHDHDGKEPAALLYCLHYYGGNPFDRPMRDQFEGMPRRRVKGYAWITKDQVNWYSKTSEGVKEALGRRIPALAFFHVPLLEYRYAIQDPDTTFIHVRREGIGCPELNSGLFTAMREHEDVMATFAGHDHDNDYAVLYHDILLAYGRMSGSDTVYNHLPIGARVIQLKEGKREFESWTDLHDGTVTDAWTYPTSFVDGPGNPDWK